jgi:hypothetical protein
MSDAEEYHGAGVPPEADATEIVEEVTDEVLDEIRHGQVEDDVSNVLEDRLEEQGVHLRPETIDDLAEEIENDASA